MAINGPRHAKTGLRTYADSEGPGQPAHTRSLIMNFTVANRIIGYYRMYEWEANVEIILCACTGCS